MKKIIFIVLLVLIPCIVFSQYIGGAGFFAHDGQLVKTITTYTGATSDSTGWITISDALIGSRPLLAREVVFYAIATDSVHATLSFLGRNNSNTLFVTNTLVSVTTYADSLPLPGNLAYSATLPYLRVIQLKGDGVNKMPGCTQFKIRVTFLNAAQQGTSARNIKFYIKWIR